MENEIWLPVVGYEGIYEISSLGRIKALHKVLKMSNGKNRTHKECILKPWKTIQGYLQMTLVKDGVRQKISMHVLVAQAFLNHVRCGFKVVVDHINGIKNDNRLVNLRLLSHRDNTALGYKNKKYSSHVGISYSKPSPKNNRIKRWTAVIQVNGECVRLGLFNTEREAIDAYTKYRLENNI